MTTGSRPAADGERNGGRGGCGCLAAVLAVALICGAGWYFAVKEHRAFTGSETIRHAWEWAFPGQPSLDREYLESEMLRRINAQREKYGRTALRPDDHLAGIARAHSRDMAENGYYADDHLNLLGENPTERARKAGYECIKATSIGVGENVAMVFRHEGYREYRLLWLLPMGRDYEWLTEDDLAGEVVLAWILSPGHYKNLMSPGYALSGLGVAFGSIDGDEHAVLVTHKFC